MVWLDREREAGSYRTEENSDEKRYFRQTAEEKKVLFGGPGSFHVYGEG